LSTPLKVGDTTFMQLELIGVDAMHGGDGH
jgi:hypothetical protein